MTKIMILIYYVSAFISDGSYYGLPTLQTDPDETHTKTDLFSMGENDNLKSEGAEVNQADRGKPAGELIKPETVVNIGDAFKTPWKTAVSKAELNGEKQLIKNWADVNKTDKAKSPLITASYLGQLDEVVKLIEDGADINQSDGNETPLTAACHMGQLSVVKKLIDYGADVNQKDKNGTPLEIAYERGKLSVFSALIDARAETPEKFEHNTEYWKLVDVSKESVLNRNS